MNKTAKMGDRLKVWMDSSDELPTAEEMAEILGGEPSSVTARLSELRKQGYVVSSTRKGYAVVKRPEIQRIGATDRDSYFATAIQQELTRARGKFNWWPDNPVEAAAIASEEMGEVVKAMNNLYHQHGDDTPEDIYTEIVQAAAMLVRLATETPLFGDMWKELK